MQAKPSDASLILCNGEIYAGSANGAIFESVAIAQDGRILRVGRTSETQALVGPSTRVVDLQGRFAMPGIVDLHLHALNGMRARLSSTPMDTSWDFARLLHKAGEAATNKGPNEWITGSSFGANALAEIEADGGKARQGLDAVSNGRPIVLRHISGHGAFVNSLALERAGITARTPNPPDGEIVKDAKSGEPTGLLRETAARLVYRSMPVPSRTDMLDIGRQVLKLFNSVGITGFGDAATTSDMLEVFKALDDAGELTCWAGFALAISPTAPGYDKSNAEKMRKNRAAMCGPHMIADTVKIYLDGVPSLRTAAMLQLHVPNQPGNAQTDGGPMTLSLSELADEIAAYDKEGLSVKVHAVGDRAVRAVLDAVEEVRKRHSATGPQHHIAHGQFITPDDIPRLSSLNVLADLCPPLWFPSKASTAHRNIVGAERYATVWPIRTILKSGADLAAGSDWMTSFPDIDPWQALAGMVTRQDPAGVFLGTHSECEALTVTEALPLFTSRSAKALRFGDRTGQLAPGLFGDVIVLDRHLLEIGPKDIANTKVLATYFNGRLVHGGI